MRRKLWSIPFTLVVVACGGEPLERGGVAVCLDGGRPSGQDVDLELDGEIATVSSLDGACPLQIALTDGTVIGLGVTDGEGNDITPTPDLAEGDAIHLVYRYRMVWGDVAGFAITDAEGVVLAAEEGSWGGALEDGDVPGLTVTRGDEVVASERHECQPLEGYRISFEGDTTVEITPVGEAALTIAGTQATALAVSAWDYGTSRDCAITDVTGFLSWVVVR